MPFSSIEVAVEVFNFGLGVEAAELDIQVNGARSTSQMDWYAAENYVCENISTKKIARVLDGLEIETVDFWKLDTEGAELEALKVLANICSNRKLGLYISNATLLITKRSRHLRGLSIMEFST